MTMISTVTTTVSTVASTASMGVITSLGLAAALTLAAFLVTKELVSASDSDIRLKPFGQGLDVAIPPLLFVLSFIVIGTATRNRGWGSQGLKKARIPGTL